LEKTKLPYLTFLAGLILIIVGWWLSYPLTINSVNDVIFNHVSALYWVGLPLTLASLYLISNSSKNSYVKWLAIVGIVLSIYSLSYFYFMLPGSDQATFRGLTEYFIKTNNLDSSIVTHSYFQWPSYFLLMDIGTSITGMTLPNFEFVMFSVLGFLFATALYVCASRAFKKTGFIAVIAFFVIMFNFLNYQVVPFALAFGLLLVIFMLETRQKTLSTMFTTIVLFTAMTLTHLFVPLFFVLYLVISLILSRNKKFGYLAVISVGIYLAVLLIRAPPAFFASISNLLAYASDFSQIVTQASATTSAPIDQIAQIFSRGVFVATAITCFIGFIVLFKRKRLRIFDKAILLTGVSYSVVGIVIFILGSRAYPLILIPIALGSSYILEGKFRRVGIPLFLILLTLFTFTLIHSTSFDSQVNYQTKTDYLAENFFIDHYGFTNSALTLMHVRAMYYVQAKEPSSNIEDDKYSLRFPRISEYEYIVYTVGLGINLLQYNYTVDSLNNEKNLNLVYNSGSSCIYVRIQNFTYSPIG
jgi:hypothetical protein